MEGDGAFPDLFFSSFEEAEAMAQLFDAQFSGFKQFQGLNSSFCSYEEAAACYSSSLSDPNSFYVPMNYAMGEEILADSFFQTEYSSYQFDSLIRRDEQNSDEFTESSSAIDQPLERKRKFQADEDGGGCKRKVQKTAKNSRRRKKRAGDEEEKNVSLSTSSGGEEEDDDSNDSRASAVIEPNGKGRSGRGAAADSQSLYAKKRRERINERLRILQNLVPNGTKVDISTMLEEAAQYVKFLQLQIKLLSSDELWMYAPLAYNGMNIGLDLMIQ